MSTVRWQQHSFSTHERMFLWKCQSFWDWKWLDLRGNRQYGLNAITQLNSFYDCSNASDMTLKDKGYRSQAALRQNVWNGFWRNFQDQLEMRQGTIIKSGVLQIRFFCACVCACFSVGSLDCFVFLNLSVVDFCSLRVLLSSGLTGTIFQCTTAASYGDIDMCKHLHMKHQSVARWRVGCVLFMFFWTTVP